MQGRIDDSGARKDANEVLVMDGPHALYEFLNASRPYPIQGLHKYDDYADQIWEMYDGLNAHRKPISTGWKVLDDFYRIVPGELTIVTGFISQLYFVSEEGRVWAMEWVVLCDAS
jgi:twinkle protein